MNEPKLFQLHVAQPSLSNAERERLLKVVRLREKVRQVSGERTQCPFAG
jgi:hypothetical protein